MCSVWAVFVFSNYSVLAQVKELYLDGEGLVSSYVILLKFQNEYHRDTKLWVLCGSCDRSVCIITSNFGIFFFLISKIYFIKIFDQHWTGGTVDFAQLFWWSTFFFYLSPIFMTILFSFLAKWLCPQETFYECFIYFLMANGTANIRSVSLCCSEVPMPWVYASGR